MSDAEKVKDFWGGSANMWREPALIHWTQHHKVQERLNFLTSGDYRKNRFEYFMEKHVGRLPVKRALTLGCGHGDLERGLALYSFAERHDGIDIAEGAVAEARRLAAAAGLKNVHYSVGDLNTIQLPRYEYDVVFGIGSVHHVHALEHLLIQVSQTLKPGGFFFLDEYIGPNQFQWPDWQVTLINEQIERMPDRFKQSVDEPRHIKGPILLHSIEEMNAIDPSEAIRSMDIVPMVSWFFDVVELKGCGGSLMHLLLEHITGNFTDDDQESIEYLNSMFNLEDELIASGKLQHDFAVIIAKKKTTAGTWARYLANRLLRKFSKNHKDTKAQRHKV